MNEPPVVPVVTESPRSEVAVVEEAISREELTVPVSTSEEKSVLRPADPFPVVATEEHAEPKKAETVSCELEAVRDTKADTLVPAEVIGIPDEELEMVQSISVEDVSSSVKDDVREIYPAPEASLPVCVPETETIVKAPNEPLAAEDILVSTRLPVDTEITSESTAPGVTAICQELEKDTSPSDVPATAEDPPATSKPVSETVPSHTAVEQLISFETTEIPEVDAPVQILSEVTLNPLLDSIDDAVPVLKPSPAQGQEKQTTELPVNPVVLQKAEPEVLTLTVTHAQGNVAPDMEERPDGSDEPAEELEAEMDEVNRGF